MIQFHGEVQYTLNNERRAFVMGMSHALPAWSQNELNQNIQKNRWSCKLKTLLVIWKFPDRFDFKVTQQHCVDLS